MGRKARAKRERRDFQKRVEALRSPFLPSERPIRLVRSTSGPKLSAALLEIAQPYMTEDMPLEIRKSVLGMAALAWNLSITGILPIPEAERQELGEDNDQHDLLQLFDGILARMKDAKERSFPDNRRLIMDWEITETRDEYRVLVASSPPIP